MFVAIADKRETERLDELRARIRHNLVDHLLERRSNAVDVRLHAAGHVDEEAKVGFVRQFELRINLILS